MVRLVVIEPVPLPVFCMFQFHYGTIGSKRQSPTMITAQMFQFHYGTIGSVV